MSENRSGLFEPFDCGGGLIFSYNERINDYLFLMEIWKSLYQRQKDCYLLTSILLWTVRRAVCMRCSLFPTTKTHRTSQSASSCATD